MLSIRTLIWIFSSCLLLMTCAASTQKKSVNTADSIRAIIDEDARLGGIRNSASESAPIADAVRNYLTALGKIDFSACPSDFSAAFARHLDAWEASIPFLEQYANLRGEMHDLFDEIRTVSPEAKMQLESYEKAIWDTWREVEKAIDRYDAAGIPSIPDIEVRTWGTMQEVLRLGNTAGRVDPLEQSSSTSIGVGALKGLNGEIAIIDGRVLVSEVNTDGTVSVREAEHGDSATLLVISDVKDWQQVPIGEVNSYEALDKFIAEALKKHGRELEVPTPVRIRGVAKQVELHVVNGACPIANPEGPPPWRYSGPAATVELVGFYAENAAGKLTHHHRHSHLHVIAGQNMGHLDEVSLEEAVLSIPK